MVADHGFHKNIKQQKTVFNIDNDNNKFYFIKLIKKSAYQNNFWRIMWHFRLFTE